MKKITLIAIATLLTVATFAQSEKYTAAMKKNIALMDSAFSKADNFIALANNFERIGVAEKNQWLPYYYAALCKVNYAFMQQDATGNDPIAEAATMLINKADSLQPYNSEISCVKSMIASVQMLVNPQQRFMQYGAISQKAMAAAMQQDPSNPRPYLLKGQNLKYTPEQFGGGCKAALPALTTAAEKFASYTVASDIAPNWGAKRNEMVMAECK